MVSFATIDAREFGEIFMTESKSCARVSKIFSSDNDDHYRSIQVSFDV
jgi:hypothetical protein